MPSPDNHATTFWVSATGGSGGDGSRQDPFSTIAEAQQAVRATLQAPGALDHDIVVNIGAGTYRLDAPLTFGAADSGRDGHVVYYQAVRGEHPVISGGIAVTSWAAVANPGLALAPGVQLWEANVGTAVDTRQLYIDGERGVRAETNSAKTYPYGFRPSFEEDQGVSGIKYAVIPSGDQNPNSPNWQDPNDWGHGNADNIRDIEAVIYNQWKMASVPLEAVQPAVGSVGLITLQDPGWTNANLIRYAPLAETDSGSSTITMVDQGTTNYLAKVDTYFSDITVGMTVSGSGLPTDRTITVLGVDPNSRQVLLSDNATATTTPGAPVGLTFTDPNDHHVVTAAPNEWSFWRVTKFVNDYDFLDQPNEWYLDRATGTLYLVAAAGTDPNRQDIELPVLEQLVTGNGASNISFEGLSFKYATWLGPNGDEGYVADQSSFRVTGSDNEANLIGHFREVERTPGNLSFHDARNITFEGDSFSHLGGVGLDFSGGAQENRIAYNIFQDISSSAVVLGGVSPADARPASANDIVRDNAIVGNYIGEAGAEFIDAAGIFVGFSRNATVARNYITDVPWAGVAIGWGWGLMDEGAFPGLVGATPNMWGQQTSPTIMEGNQITDNYITRFMQKAWDGGAIYTTGFQDGNVSDGLNGTVIARNYAYDKTPGAGSNIFYTDGGSRFLELDGNISFGNDQGYVNFGPVFHPGDPLNGTAASNPFAVFPKLGTWVPYGSDIGGCITYGDILYLNNYWQNLWGSLQPVWDSTKPGSELLQLFEELLVYLKVVLIDYAQWPNTPLYYDPGQYTDANGIVYPNTLDFLVNHVIDGLQSINTDILGGFATTSNTLACVDSTPAVVSRADSLGGLVSFGLLSLADGHVVSLLANAVGRSANALAYDDTTGGAWLASEGQALGSVASGPGEIGTGVWLPTATLDGILHLAITSLQTDGNSAFATFEGGYQATFTLGGSRSIPNGGIFDDVAVTVKRLAAYDNGLAFYEADARTGAIVVNGNTLAPDQPGYLQAALANAWAEGLVVDASRLPAFGQEVTLGGLPLNDAKSYGLLVLVNNNPNEIYSSYSTANPGGATQILAFGDSGGGITFGIEDILVTSGQSDRDYNDLLVRFHPADLLG